MSYRLPGKATFAQPLRQFREAAGGGLGQFLAGLAGPQSFRVGKGPFEPLRASGCTRSSSGMTWMSCTALVKAVWITMVSMSETISSGGDSNARA